MKILYVASRFDYGRPERGLSFEHYNFFDTLLNTGNEIVYFDYPTLLRRAGRGRMNRALVETAVAEKPDLVFVFLSENELAPATVAEISRLPGMTTLNWFADDHWRFDNFSRYWAPAFNWVVTTDPEAVAKYEAIGIRHVVLSQWACNHFLYRNLQLPPVHDVSFVGQAYGNRREIVAAIEQAGVAVTTRGQGWTQGRADQEDMIDLINRSRINLNMANASVIPTGGFVAVLDRYALYTPLIRRPWRKIRSRLLAGSTRARPVFQIKGRNFEVPGCGGFLLTDDVPGLEEFYRPGRDIACYRSTGELVEKVLHYLGHEEERRRIAESGYATTMERHTWVHRFNALFSRIGLQCDFSLERKVGRVREAGA